MMKPYRSGQQPIAHFETVRVRNDLPDDPYLFPACKEGLKAALVLEESQAEDEQPGSGLPSAAIGHQDLETDLVSAQLPQGTYEQPRTYRSGQDTKIASVLADLRQLHAHPEYYAWMCTNYPEYCEDGSGIMINRVGLEHDDVVAIWDGLHSQKQFSREMLMSMRMLKDEDDLGDNPEYYNAKLLWWKQNKAIDGIIFEHIRSLRHDPASSTFLSEQGEI